MFARARAGLVVLHPAPNHVNGRPNKLFEYMSAGLAVIASHFPLWREIVEDARCGMCVDPLDAAAIAAAMRRLADGDEAAEMGRRGREAVPSRFNWDSEAPEAASISTRASPEAARDRDQRAQRRPEGHAAAQEARAGGEVHRGEDGRDGGRIARRRAIGAGPTRPPRAARCAYSAIPARARRRSGRGATTASTAAAATPGGRTCERRMLCGWRTARLHAVDAVGEVLAPQARRLLRGM